MKIGKTPPKTYLFIGEDNSKQEKIAEIHSEFLNTSDKNFNYEVISAKDSGRESLKDILSRFPVGKGPRVLRIKEVEALSAKEKELLLDYLDSPVASLVLVLESRKEELKDAFLKGLSYKVEFLHIAKKDSEINVFDLCRAMKDRNLPWALKLLKDLDIGPKNAPQVLGAIRCEWEKMKHLFNSRDLEESFRLLYETDKSIKTGKLEPYLALEMLVIGLTKQKERKLLS